MISTLKGKTRFLLPTLYLGLAVFVWIDFVQTPPDGLANLVLMVVTLPIALVGLMITWALGETDFVLLPNGLGYYLDHAVYYWPSVALIAAVLYWLCAAVSRRR
jgi:hypothetical protein